MEEGRWRRLARDECPGVVESRASVPKRATAVAGVGAVARRGFDLRRVGMGACRVFGESSAMMTWFRWLMLISSRCKCLRGVLSCWRALNFGAQHTVHTPLHASARDCTLRSVVQHVPLFPKEHPRGKDYDI